MNQKVLVIDDSEQVHELLDVRLSALGCDLIHATRAAEGLALARMLRPDLVLLDVVMPDVMGFEVLRQLKEIPETQPIPVIFLTVISDSLNKVTGLDLGAVDYVTKPFDIAELQARVRAALRMKRFQDILSERAQIDGLTALGNRAFFDCRIAEQIETARRYGRKGGMIVIDLDNFKGLNDTFGHPFGDRVLQSVGELLRAETRPGDFPCRYGGEEFVVLPTEADLEQAIALARHLHRQIGGLRWEQKRKTVGVTASIGVACTTQFPGTDDLSPSGLLAAADAALYRAKQLGRNRVETATLREIAEAVRENAWEGERLNELTEACPSPVAVPEVTAY